MLIPVQVAVTLVALAALGAGVFLGDSVKAYAPPDASEILQACEHAAPVSSCVQARLETVMLAAGAEPTFSLLDQLSVLDREVLQQQHAIAHHLGRVALDYYPSVAAAMPHCPVTMASGCFHGVLERHFNEAGPPTRPADVTQLCTQAEGKFRGFQCLHGLGHGLDMAAMHQLPTALAWCELFPENWDQVSCAGGVFMENVQGDTSMEHELPETGPGGHAAHGEVVPHAMAMDWVRMKKDDPLYPCNVVAAKWWHPCYWMQSSVMLQQGYTFAEVFAGCDLAPDTFDLTCYQSMGRDLSGRHPGETAKVIDDCLLGNATKVGHCFYGAVQEMVNNKASPAPGFAFCPIIPENSKDLCYRAVGVMIVALVPQQAERMVLCEQAEPAYVKSCREAATG